MGSIIYKKVKTPEDSTEPNYYSRVCEFFISQSKRKKDEVFLNKYFYVKIHMRYFYV